VYFLPAFQPKDVKNVNYTTDLWPSC